MYRSKIPTQPFVAAAAAAAAAAASSPPPSTSPATCSSQQQQQQPLASPVSGATVQGYVSPAVLLASRPRPRHPMGGAAVVGGGPTTAVSGGGGVMDVSQQNRALRLVEPIPYKRGEATISSGDAAVDSSPSSSSSSSSLSPVVIPLTTDLFKSLLQCPKRFMLDRYLTRAEMPPLTAGDRLLMEDGTQFAQLCRQKYTLGANENAIFRITSPSFENAVEETAKVLEWYFGTFLPRQDARTLGPITLLMPAFNAFVDANQLLSMGREEPSSPSDTVNPANATTNTPENAKIAFELRSRFNILQYHPSSNVWMAHASRASTDVLSAKDKEGLYLKQLFQLYTLRHCADVPSFYAGVVDSSSATPPQQQQQQLPHQRGAATFTTSFHDLKRTAPLFFNTLSDAAISVGASTSRAMATIDTLQSRMVPLTEDCFNRGTLATMIAATPASALRGGFLKAQLSVDGLRDALSIRTAQTAAFAAMGRNTGDAAFGKVGGAAADVEDDSEAAAAADGSSAAKKKKVSWRGGAAKPSSDGAAIAALTADSSSSPQEALGALLAQPTVSHLAVTDALADRGALEYPIVLPPNAALLSDMALGDALMAHCAHVLRDVLGNSEGQLAKAVATAEPKASLKAVGRDAAAMMGNAAADADLSPSSTTPAAVGQSQSQSQSQPSSSSSSSSSLAALASECYKEACSDCAYFKKGFCKATPIAADSSAADDPSVVFNLPGARAAAKKKLYRANLRTAAQLMGLVGIGGAGGGKGATTAAAIASHSSTTAPTTSSSSSLVSESNSLLLPDVRLSDRQQMYVHCAANKLVAVNPSHLRQWLAAIRYPLVAIDFESAAFALPRFSKLKPFGQVPFQFSAMSYTKDPFGSDWVDQYPPSLTDGTAKSSSLNLDDFTKSFPPPVPPVVTTSFCYIGQGFEPRDDPRRRVGLALNAMLTRSREAQLVYNAEEKAAGRADRNPAVTTHAFGDASSSSSKTAAVRGMLASGGVANVKKKMRGGNNKDAPPTPIVHESAGLTITPPMPAPVRGSSNKFRADAVLIEGIHSTISKAKDLKIIMDDPTAHGCLIGHNVSFERTCFQTISQLVREGGSGGGSAWSRGKTAAGPSSADVAMSDGFDSLVFMDTLKLVSDGIIHPASEGSNSLKKLVPALIPHTGPQYSELVIADGHTASATYRDWLSAMTQKIPFQSKTTSEAAPTPPATVHNTLPSSTASPPPQSSSSSLSPRDYDAYARQLASFNAIYDKRREELIAYCNADTEQMVAVVREISRIGKLAEYLMALGGSSSSAPSAGGDGKKKKQTAKKVGKKGKADAVAAAVSSAEEGPATNDAMSDAPAPSSALWVDLGKGWVGIPQELIVATREEGSGNAERR